MTTCYELRGPESNDTVHILVHGFAIGGGRSGPLRLRRAGPFVPPFSFPLGPGAIVLTDDTRRQLEKSELTGLQFREVVKEHVADFRWQDWVFGDTPLGYLFNSDEMNEPEDLVDARPHSPEAAEQIGPLWELTPPLQGKLRRRRQRPVLRPELFAMTDFVRFDDDWEQILVSERATQWLQSRYDRWLTLRPCD